MRISLTKDIFGEANISDSQFAGEYGPKPMSGEGVSDEQLRKSIENPIGCETLHEAARGCRKVLIVTDDNTRATPISRLIRPSLDELNTAGILPEQITFLIGLGTHRPMKPEEIESKFGADIASKYRIVNHCWNDPASLASLGKCDLGFEVTVNKLVIESDFIISLGSIVPHATTGFSGGGKTIMTGIAGEKTIENTHWKALDYSMSEILGNYDNPVRKVINDLSRKVGLRMIINTVLFDESRVHAIAAGDLDLAHRKGVEFCREVYCASIPEKSDVVIAEAYPADIDLRQAIKAICAADLVCRDGGVIVLAAECPEGVAPQFPEFAEYGFKNPDLLYEKVNSGEFKQKLMAYTLVAVGRIISRRVRAVLVCPNIDSATAERMGFIWAGDLHEAVDKAFAMVHSKAQAVVLKEASILLPSLPEGIT
jgi:nickel-dependent lactate racemase